MTQQEITERSRQRRLAMLAAMADGMTNLEIAAQLGLSTSAVRLYTKQLFEEFKAKSHTREELIAQAFRAGALK